MADERDECPLGIHGWRQRMPNGLCPWCKWETAEAALRLLAEWGNHGRLGSNRRNRANLDPIIRFDDDGKAPHGLDEFVAHDVTVHFEAMGDSQFWIGVTTADGRSWAINCGAVNPRAKGYAMCEQDE